MSDATILPMRRRADIVELHLPDEIVVPVDVDVVEQLSFPDLEFGPAGTALMSIDDRFRRFHRDNPHVYVHLRNYALDLVRAGRTRVSIGMLFEVLRWSALKVRPDGDYKLNNDYRSRYARLLADTVPELADVFEMRRLAAPK